LLFCVWILFVICCLGFRICQADASDMRSMKVSFLNGDYKQAILEGEKLLAKDAHSDNSDELYYILGISYLKDGNYLRASDIFEIILDEFKNSKFKEEAKLALGDTYFLRNDFARAEEYYKDLIEKNPQTNLKAQIYYRLSQSAFKRGDTEQGVKYLDKIKEEFPLNPELRLNKDLSSLPDSSENVYYSVQVGAFSKIVNANNLVQKLSQKGYPAYIEQANSAGQVSYRVRVGRFHLRQEAVDLEKKLFQEGYPTKVFP